ncbi:MAG TPA: ATP-binding protein, partial [Chitinophagales bacterium]|nr:ATP-binding protein [Chitinophagales bacterium]
LRFAKIRQTSAGQQQEEDFDKALELLNTASQDIRKISHALMPSALERLGLTEATAQFCHAMESSSRMEIDFQHYGLEERLPQRFELLVYRIIQELLNNIVKYAEAGDVLVQISRHDNQLSITVEDDGKGFDVNIIRQKDGIGLHSMQQRIALLGGRMDIDSAIGKGTSVNIELPVS